MLDFSRLPEVEKDEDGDEERYDRDGVAEQEDEDLPVFDAHIRPRQSVVQAAGVVGIVVPPAILKTSLCDVIWNESNQKYELLHV